MDSGECQATVSLKVKAFETMERPTEVEECQIQGLMRRADSEKLMNVRARRTNERSGIPED